MVISPKFSFIKLHVQRVKMKMQVCFGLAFFFLVPKWIIGCIDETRITFQQ